MKTSVVIFILLVFPVSLFAQTTQKETEKIATFCKVWGFLKYYHPLVAQNILDWDQEFMMRIKYLPHLNTKEEISGYYSEWIDGLGEVKVCKKCDNDIPDSLKINLDLRWLSDTTLFTARLMDQLRYIQKNRNQKDNFYVQKAFAGNADFKNEKTYKDSVFPSSGLRLLGLARYWNIYNYFFPYKYLIGRDWNLVLDEMIPAFRDAKDTTAYHLAMLELTTKVNDSHSALSTDYTDKYFGLKWAPFKFRIIDNTAIVTSFYNDTLCKKNDIRQGDVFLKVNDLSIEEIMKINSKYMGGSNEPARVRHFYNAIFNGNEDSVKVIFERDGLVSDKIINRYLFAQLNYPRVDEGKGDTSKILDGNIGYVHLGRLMPKQVKETMEQLRNTKAIIFDIRNYPNRTMYLIAEFLKSEKSFFVRCTNPDLSYPGVFQHKPPLDCGKKNDHAYAGKVVLLFNEQTQSHAEFTCMALQTAPNVICIGSQTAGADGNASVIHFPGAYPTYMTGLGVYYPDGRETQRIGIVPDIEVKPTIAGIKSGRDEVLEKAIEIINKR